MTTIQARLVGEEAVLPRAQFDRLVALARRCSEVELQVSESDASALPVAGLAGQGGSFEWLGDDPDLYTAEDLKVRYR